jgi:hypothetical protein
MIFKTCNKNVTQSLQSQKIKKWNSIWNTINIPASLGNFGYKKKWLSALMDFSHCSHDDYLLKKKQVSTWTERNADGRSAPPSE